MARTESGRVGALFALSAYSKEIRSTEDRETDAQDLIADLFLALELDEMSAEAIARRALAVHADEMHNPIEEIQP